MPLSGCNSPSSGGDSGNPADGAQRKCQPSPTDGSSTKDNAITIVFDPAKSTKVTKCDRIVHVQFNRQYADGKVVKPGDYYAGFKYQDRVTTDDGWVIDHLGGETTPDYQQGTGDGKKNGGTAKAKVSDGPNTGGGDKGFYDAKTNPLGWKKVYYEFVTYAWCMKGTDCGKWYEGVKWEYTKTWEDERDGKDGISNITDKNVTAGPSKSQLDAFDKFNKDKKFEPCK